MHFFHSPMLFQYISHIFFFCVPSSIVRNSSIFTPILKHLKQQKNVALHENWIMELTLSVTLLKVIVFGYNIEKPLSRNLVLRLQTYLHLCQMNVILLVNKYYEIRGALRGHITPFKCCHNLELKHWIYAHKNRPELSKEVCTKIIHSCKSKICRQQANK